MRTRIIMSCICLLMLLGLNILADTVLFPMRAKDVGVRQLEDDNAPFVEVQTFAASRRLFTGTMVCVVIALLALLWCRPIKKYLGGNSMKSTKSLMLMLILLAVIIVGGCRKPYDTPEFEEIQNNETAFVIPLEGKTSDQGKFASADHLSKLQVATKRIQITHRWNQTGRRGYQGEWIDSIKVIKVNRTPVTRQWTTDASTGTSTKDEAIWVESKDSVEFAVGFSCSSLVEEKHAATFLYHYTSASNADIMDTEVRARIQSVAAEKCGEYDLDELRGKKSEVIAAVREDVIPFFAAKGLTITTIGMFGGFKYKNAEIQIAIDNVFKAQQLEDVALAQKKAAVVEKETIEIRADAEASRIDKIAAAEAAKIERINIAAEKAQKNPLFLQLRQLDVEAERIAKWNGQFPNWYMGGGMAGTNPNLLLNVPAEVK